jgi:uncharacterized membrane protein YgaE (UPF0421/DUF939 family)
MNGNEIENVGKLIQLARHLRHNTSNHPYRWLYVTCIEQVIAILNIVM